MPSHKIIDNLGERGWETSGSGREMRRGGTRRERHVRETPQGVTGILIPYIVLCMYVPPAGPEKKIDFLNFYILINRIGSSELSPVTCRYYRVPIERLWTKYMSFTLDLILKMFSIMSQYYCSCLGLTTNAPAKWKYGFCCRVLLSKWQRCV